LLQREGVADRAIGMAAPRRDQTACRLL